MGNSFTKTEEYISVLTGNLNLPQKKYHVLLLEKNVEEELLRFYSNISYNENEKLKITDQLINSIHFVIRNTGKNCYERERLEYLAKIISDYSGIPSLNSHKFKDIFRSKNAYIHFLNTLHHLNIIDEKNIPKWGFQAAVNAMFRSINFKQEIFIENLTLAELIKFLNKYFDTKIKAKDKLSDSSNYERAVENYFKENFVKN